MTAAVGHPTFRLVRAAIEAYELGDLAPGAAQALRAPEIANLFASPASV